MTDEIRAKAQEIGTAWGEQEVELWLDQHDDDDFRMPEWTMGTYSGSLPGVTDHDEQFELADEVDLIIDRAAREVWNAAREGVETLDATQTR